jgi:hypothetical protein
MDTMGKMCFQVFPVGSINIPLGEKSDFNWQKPLKTSTNTNKSRNQLISPRIGM